VPLATKIIREVGPALDAASFHLYTFNSYALNVQHGVTASALTKGNLSHLWSPSSLALASESIRMMQAVVANTSSPNIPIWLSETNSICSVSSLCSWTTILPQCMQPGLLHCGGLVPLVHTKLSCHSAIDKFITLYPTCREG
jgi:hypothetical protein